MQHSPPRPPFALTLGVTGHRPQRDPEPCQGPNQNPPLQEDKVQAGIDGFLATLTGAVEELSGAAKQWFDPAPPVVALVSSLAEGSDRIAAKAALAHGMPLDVVLPCARATYEQTFADDASGAEFATLLNKARACLTLPFTVAAGVRPDLSQAYESAGPTFSSRSGMASPPRGAAAPAKSSTKRRARARRSSSSILSMARRASYGPAAGHSRCPSGARATCRRPLSARMRSKRSSGCSFCRRNRNTKGRGSKCFFRRARRGAARSCRSRPI